LFAGALLGFSLALGGAVLAGFTPPGLGGVPTHPIEAQPPGLSPHDARVLAEILDRVKREYIEPVSDRQLIDNAVRGMLAELDPHSQYLDPGEYNEIRISTSGTFTGVGLEVQTGDGRNRWKGVRPRVRGVAMNPVDHPMGGGEGRASGGHPRSRNGAYAKGKKTRSPKKYSDGLIIAKRKK
jgi:hypothetical protein